MKIECENERISLVWEYTLRKKKKIVEEKEYNFFSSSFPKELRDFLDSDFLWIFEDEGKVYVVPFEEEGAKKIRLSGSGNNGLVFTIPKKLFPCIDKMNFVRIVFDGRSVVLSLF